MTEATSDAKAVPVPWWQPVKLKPGDCWRSSIGPLSVYLQRHPDEWLLAWESEEESTEHQGVCCAAIAAIPESLPLSRYVFHDSPPSFCLKPRLQDRPVVVRTTQPVHVPPGEQVTFYISSPVCVSIELNDLKTQLRELPTVQLSDTWFGPSTREGELCYAAKTKARNDKSEVPLRSHRAVTPVSLRNRSEAMLAIEKLSIPLPFLAVYGQADGSLWTDPVSLEHNGEDQLATLKIGSRPAGTTLLSPARIPVQKNRVVRAIINLFAD